MVTVGSDQFRYEVVPSWPRMPKYWTFGDCTDGAVNSRGEVHIFNRGDHPLTIWDTDGNFISSWGEAAFKSPHGIHIAPDDGVWLVDTLEHVVTKHTPDGKTILTLGNRGQPMASFEGLPFNMPSGVALAPNGEIFVSDGYGGHRVHKFSPEGELLLSWGKEGDGPGEFVNLHNIGVDKSSRVFICDRENDRIQIFDPEGNFLEQWDIESASGVCFQDDLAYVVSGGTWISIRDLEGEVLARFGGDEGPGGEPLMKSAHGICVDPEGSIYATEIIINRKVVKFQRL